MGSVFPKARAPSYVCGLFSEIRRQATVAAEREQEPDAQLIADLIADALAHPDTRKPVLLALATFVVVAYGGGVTDPQEFAQTPPG